jgi:glycosyltransferase involved in cell wall biosynthesis
LEAVGRIKQLTYEAREAQPGVARVHNAVTFVRQVTGTTVRANEVPSSRRAVVIYPWGNAASGWAGASSRLHMLVDYLERNGQSVRVITAGGDSARIGRYTWVEAHDASSWGEAGWTNHFFGATKVLLTWLGGGHNEIEHIVNYIHWRRDYRWRNRLTEAIRWADDVYLKYSFYADIAKSLADKHSTQIWITNYDIVHKSLPQSITKYILQFLELRANRLINLRACVTSTEQNILKLSGMDAQHIENVTRTALGEWVEPNDPHVIVTQLIRRDSRQSGIIMFVGSLYKPNIDAARLIKKIALESNLIGNNVCFVVAGGCWAPETARRFVAIGEIDALALHALYSVASIVLNPVQAGSGSAVKMLEAMAHGKCVISTSVGARGHDLHDGVECVIEDDLDTFPARIEQWLPSSPEKSAMELRARQRAVKNDYMTVFPKYATPSNAQWHGTGRQDASVAGSAVVDYAQLLGTPALARDPVIASLVARRGVEAQDLATRRLRKKMADAIQLPVETKRDFFKSLGALSANLVVSSLIIALLDVALVRSDAVREILSCICWIPRADRDQSTHVLYEELCWLLNKMEIRHNLE